MSAAAFSLCVLGELCLRTSVWRPEQDPRETIAYVDVSAVSSEQLRIVHPQQLRASEVPSRARKIIMGGDTIFATIRPKLARIALVPDGLDDELASTAFCVIRPRRDLLMPEFAYFAVQTEEFVQAVARHERGASYPAVRDKDVFGEPIPLPPLAEQRKIAAVLGKVQAAVEVEGELIRVTRELKQAALSQFFTRGLRGEPQKQSAIGPIPESWDVVPLSKVHEFLQYGTSAKCSLAVQGIPVLRIPNIVGGVVDTTELKYAELSESEIEKLKLARNDVLFVRTNGQRHLIGRCSVYRGAPSDAVFASYLIRVRFKPGAIDSDYFQYYSETDAGRSFLAGQANGAADGKFNLNTQAIKATLIPLPNYLAEQREIAAHLATIDAKLAHHEARQKLLRELFRTLLRDLMTGRRRVTHLDLAELVS